MKTLRSEVEIAQHMGQARSGDAFGSWLTAAAEEKAAALREMSVDTYTSVGIPRDIAEKLHDDWLSELRSCATSLTQAQFNFVINRNF